MATVAPKFSFCLEQQCSKLKITDITGLWNNTTNTKGWSNTQVPGGVELSEIIQSSLTFNHVTTNTDTTFFLAATSTGVNLYPNEATDSFSFAEFDWSGADGIYNVDLLMVLDNGHTSEFTTQKILFTCKAEQCVKELWSDYYKLLSCGKNATETYRKALEASAMLKAVQYAFLCNSDTNATKILEVLTKICSLKNNDCGCN